MSGTGESSNAPRLTGLRLSEEGFNRPRTYELRWVRTEEMVEGRMHITTIYFST